MLNRLLPLVLFAFLTVFLFVSLGENSAKKEIKKNVPDFSGEDLFTKNKITSDYIFQSAKRSEQDIIFHFFASWCPTCPFDIPILQKMKKEKNIKIIGVNWRDKKSDALIYIEKYKQTYDYVIFDKDGLVGLLFGITGTPESFLVNKDKKILFHQIGNL